jgi:hypothetical protein
LTGPRPHPFLHRLDHGSHRPGPLGTGPGHLLADDRAELVVGELGRQVAGENPGLGALAGGQLVAARVHVQLRGLAALAELGAHDALHRDVVEGDLGLARDLRLGDRREQHPQRRDRDLVTTADRVGQVVLHLLLEGRHALLRVVGRARRRAGGTHDVRPWSSGA